MTNRRFTLDAHPIRWELAGLAVELALLRLHLAFERFNPLQPRVPAGHDGGGQWTSDDSFIQPAAGRERDRPSGQELAKDPYLNRHIVDGHVGKTDQELIARLAAMQECILFGLLPNQHRGKASDLSIA
ncbi:hypothetical protein [Methylobacterium oxalidis]|uniref:hypothetical protein n=1 Tax=Methylobacterium oxalidis TaxID=944322 RepID=UPI0011BFCE86|nr:hypothetical protein [Methylobacterium oxalidis]